jgi:high-affinity nickel-transport protein
MVGALWGLGHSLTILVVGGAIVAFGLIVPPRVEAALEFCVALMLIALGAFNVWDTLKKRSAGSEHPAGEPHLHRAVSLRPIAIGVMHGLAGSAAIALLVLTTIESATRALLYLLVFGIGTTAGMALLTGAIVLPVAAASRRFVSLDRYLSGFTGIASLALGAFLAFHLAGDILG